MLQSILEDVRREFRLGNMVTRIAIVNIAAFVIINLVRLGFWITNAGQVHPFYYQIRRYLTLSSDPWFDLTHPWVFITAMFLHEGFWHLLWNMLFLYWFGRIVGDLIGNHRILPIYLLGGLFAGLVFVGSAQLFHYGAAGEIYALGASGAVMALVMAAGVIAPDYRIHLLIIGEVKLKYVVAVLLFIDLISLAGNVNTGGHFAHLGGALFGYLFIVILRQGYDLGIGINNLEAGVMSLFQRRERRPRLVYRNDSRPAKNTPVVPDNTQTKLDAILEKIKHKGIEALTPAEKDFLDNQSKS
jgi:membrane associated rhomboid family serine protease